MKQFQAELLFSSDGHIIAKIKGRDVWQAFRHETGGHCCQRVPVTESKGRKQTSMIAVAVLPIKEDVWEPLRDDEIEVITQCGGGPGGQKVNKTASAVRMKHIETGLSVFINGRDQYSNKKEALKILTARVSDYRKCKSDTSYAEYRREQLGTGCRGDKVRTYNFMRGDIVDHRLNKKTNNIKAFMKGEFSVLFK